MLVNFGCLVGASLLATYNVKLAHFGPDGTRLAEYSDSVGTVLVTIELVIVTKSALFTRILQWLWELEALAK